MAQWWRWTKSFIVNGGLTAIATAVLFVNHKCEPERRALAEPTVGTKLDVMSPCWPKFLKPSYSCCKEISVMALVRCAIIWCWKYRKATMSVSIRPDVVLALCPRVHHRVCWNTALKKVATLSSLDFNFCQIACFPSSICFVSEKIFESLFPGFTTNISVITLR